METKKETRVGTRKGSGAKPKYVEPTNNKIYTLYFIVLLTSLFSCSSQDEKFYKWSLLCNSDGNSQYVKCDSFQMTSKSEAVVYADNKKYKISCTEIVPELQTIMLQEIIPELNKTKPKLYNYSLLCKYDNGWSWLTLECDSFQRISKSEFIIYVDNKKMKIFYYDIIPKQKTYFNKAELK